MKIYQIFFKKEQEILLEPEFIPLLNGVCSPYFESKVIEQLVLQEEHLGEPYFGVVSYKLRQKLGFMRDNWKNNKNELA